MREFTEIMETSLRIISVFTFFIGAALIIPAIGDNIGISSAVTVDSGNGNATRRKLISLKLDSQGLKNVNIRTNSSTSDYEPPNYGGPDSPYGSGTR